MPTVRTDIKLAIPFLVILAAGGCARQSPMTPVAPASSSTSSAAHFVLRPNDPRLPAPGLEEEAATPEDRASFGRLAGRAAPLQRTAGPNEVVVWNRLTRELGIGAKLPPPLMARAYALVHVGLYEALAASADRPRGNLQQHSLAAGAATRVLGYLFPGSLSRIQEVASEEIALDPFSGRSALGAWAVGNAVGRAVVARGMSDGSDAVYTGTPPTGQGIWTGTNPVLPMCGTWKTWVLQSGPEIQPEPPYAFGSAKDLADVQEVLDVSLSRTPDQIAIVHKWADVTPPAIWNDLLDDRIVGQNMDPVASARASAYLNVAMADAFIECWACKYQYWIARPFQRIPGLVTVITTPNFPSYTSGHSTISAAAAAVLAEVFPAERDYFIQQSEEAALSRLYGGIHFRHDNEEGTRVGTEIGARVVERMRAASSGPLLAGN
jgi:hypothetical protein